MNPDLGPEKDMRWRVWGGKIQIFGGLLTGLIGLPAFFYGSYVVADDIQSRELAINAGKVPEKTDTTVALVACVGGVLSCMFSLDLIEDGRKKLRDAQIDQASQNLHLTTKIYIAHDGSADVVDEQKAS